MPKKEKKPQSKTSKIVKTVFSSLGIAIFLSLAVAVDIFAPTYRVMIEDLTGTGRYVKNSPYANSSLDLSYYSSDYTKDEMAEKEHALNEEIVGEGVVMLKHTDGYFPYDKGTSFSIFGRSSVDMSSIGAISLIQGNPTTLKEAFTNAGLSINENLWDFYNSGKGKDYGLGQGSIDYGDSEDFSINECPISVITSDSSLVSSFKGTKAVYVLKRVNGEGRDLPRSMYNHTNIEADKTKSYLEPNSVELGIFDYLNQNFDDVTLVVNTCAAMELGWVNNYPHIHTILSLASPGASGLNALAKIFSGAINPSGRTVDTYAYDAFSSPAMMNYGDYQYHDATGKMTDYDYISYLEGIYVGYKYYETRYLEQGNSGDYDYDKTVLYPFGYGLSLTTFDWSNMALKENDDTFTIDLTVTNTGSVAGKDVVEIYLQKPYTNYDKTNGVEKSAVDLVGYAKTSLLEPKQKETVEVTFDKKELASYDAKESKTYIVDPGTYYVTAGHNSHNAVNNIIAAQENITIEGADKELVGTYTISGDTPDTTTFAKDATTGATITNLFDSVDGGLSYLSRQDWTGTYPVHDGTVSSQISTWGNEINGTDDSGKPCSYTYTKQISSDNIAKIASYDSNAPQETFTDTITLQADNGLKLIDLRGADYQDEKWDKLLDELSADDYYRLINLSGYQTAALSSIDKPLCIDFDSATGITMGGTNMTYQATCILASTYNHDLATQYGEMIGNECLIGGCDGWYAPAMNIHRSPFSGRNSEYYSEDPFLSGETASLEVRGAAEKGVYAFIKHFALNDQENHRGDRDGQYGVCTFCNEQAMRETYLKPFEMCIKAQKVTEKYVAEENGVYVNKTRQISPTLALMTSFNRLAYTWAGGDYALLTSLLRNEWGFEGFVITDSSGANEYMNGQQMIEAGGDARLSYSDTYSSKLDLTNSSIYHYAREAAHHLLYTVTNSKAMNGAMSGSTFAYHITPYQWILIGTNVLSFGMIGLLTYFTIRRFTKRKKKTEDSESGAKS